MQPTSLRFAAVCFLAALAACNRNSPANAGKLDTDLYSYLPADSTWIAGVRVAEVRPSPIYNQLRVRLPSGVQPYEKEATELVAAGNGVETLVLARGHFDKARFEQDNRNSGGVMLANDLIAIGSKHLVDQARAHHGGGLSALAKQIPPDHIWAVTNQKFDLPLPERSNLSNLSRLTDDLRLGVIGANVTDAIAAKARFEMGSPESANRMLTAVKGFIGLARLSTPTGREQLLKVLDAIHVEQKEKLVTAQADWPSDLVDELIKSIPAR